VVRRPVPWALALLCALAVALVGARAWAYPTIDAPVTDLAGVVDPAKRDAIVARIVAAKDTAAVAVLVVRTTQPEAIEDYSLHVAQAWRGGDPPKDAGVLVVLAIDDHRSRMDVSSGLEARLPDSRAKEVLDGARDKLRAADYGGAISDIVDQVIAAAAAAPSAAASPPPPPPAPAGPTDFLILFGVFGLFFGVPIAFVTLIVWAIVRAAKAASRPRYYWGQTGEGNWAWIPYVPMTRGSSGGDSSDSSWSSSTETTTTTDFGSIGGGGGGFSGGGASSSW
jgi:uncharacterized protein